MKTLFLSLLLSIVAGMLLVVSGCHFGIQAEDFVAAHGPQGVKVEMRLKKGIHVRLLAGELLEVREDGFLVNVDNKEARQIQFVHTSVILRAEFAQFDGFGKQAIGAKLDVSLRDKLRVLSRFPQGLSSELLAALLSAQKQTTVENIGVK
jgi:hypothetical protein